MANRSQYKEPTYEVKIFGSIDEMDEGISRLTDLLNELKKLQDNRTGYAAPDVSVMESRIKNTMLRVYGAKTQQYARFKDFVFLTILHYGDGESNLEQQSIFEQVLRKVIANIESLISEIEVDKRFFKPAADELKQALFLKGQYYDAVKVILDTIRSAQQSIVVVDPYFGKEVLDLLEAKASSVEVRILTGQVSAPLQVVAAAFSKQYGKLHIRSSNLIHDRFIVIDDRDFYHFGGSIKDLGSKLTMYTKIQDATNIDHFRKTLKDAWNNATVIM